MRQQARAALGVGGLLLLAACGPGPGTTDSGAPSTGAPVTSSAPDRTVRAADPAPSAQTSSSPSSDTASATTVDPSREITLAVVGDIMLDRWVVERIDDEGTRAVLDGVRDELTSADLTIGNLETPIGDGGTRADKRFAFLSDPSTVDVLTDGGFDLVSLANNHILDYGVTDMQSTQALLDDAGIRHVGVGRDEAQAHRPTVLEVGGLRLAFLSYLNIPVERSGFDASTWTAGPDTPGLAWGDPDRVAEDVEAARSGADHVIVLLHSGWEKTETLSPEQQALGHAALDAGATAVLGSHPHRLQSYTKQDGQFVAWSLGNFVFDYPTGTPETDSAILRLTLDAEEVTDVDWVPVSIVRGFPVVLDPATDGAAAMRAIERLEATP